MQRRLLISAAAMGVAALVSGTAQGQVLFDDDFTDASGTGYNVNLGPSGDDFATFGFDYSAVGIPAAPGSTGTTGLKLGANVDAGIFSGMSVSPAARNFLAESPAGYTVQFYTWQNTVGPMPAGGSGSTQLTTYGVGTSGDVAHWQGSASYDGVMFGATGDGGSSVDWRAYVPGTGGAVIPANDGTNGVNVYNPAVTSLNATDPFWAQFTGDAPPPAQTALFPNQTGVPQPGAPAFDWKRVEMIVTPDEVIWEMDDVVIATVNQSNLGSFGTMPDLEGTIFFGQSDINASSSTDPNDRALLFGLIDNVTVTAVPEPATAGLLMIAGAAMLGRRRRNA